MLHQIKSVPERGAIASLSTLYRIVQPDPTLKHFHRDVSLPQDLKRREQGTCQLNSLHLTLHFPAQDHWKSS